MDTIALVAGFSGAVFLIHGLMTPARYTETGGVEINQASPTFDFRTSRLEQTKNALVPRVVIENPNALWLNGSPRISGSGFDIPLIPEHLTLDGVISPSEAIELYRSSVCRSQVTPSTDSHMVPLKRFASS